MRLSAGASRLTSVLVFAIAALLVVIAMAFLNATAVQSADQSEIPGQTTVSNFYWLDVKEPAGRFLVPTDWHVSTSKGKLLGSFVVSQTVNGDHRDRLNPQLSVNPISLARMHHGLLSEQIETYTDSIEADHRKTVEHLESVDFGNFRGSAIRFRARLDGQMHRFHRYYIADDSSDMLLVMTFSASIAVWDSVWEIGRIMMTNFELESDIRANR